MIVNILLYSIVWCTYALCALNTVGAFELTSTLHDQITRTVEPVEIADVLFNPGIGLADFHFGWGHPPSPEEYPQQTVAYFRWTWAELEPTEGNYNYSLIDETIAQAKAKGETLGFRILTDFQAGSPSWLLKKGIASVTVDGGVFPDYNDSLFLRYHERLLHALGRRYANAPNVDHVDIGSVGCWGEWNRACCRGVDALCEKYYPTASNQRRIIDWYFEYFHPTPLVMLVGGPLRYAVARGAGWRGDCFGDYGLLSPDWNHMSDLYGQVVKDPVIQEAWKRGPVHFEVCGVIANWYDKGWDIDAILQKGLEWHVSLLNAKSSAIPPAWRSRFDTFLKKAGYRFVLRRMTHPAQVRASRTLHVNGSWENIGVAPIYHPWPLAYRLRAASDHVPLQWTSTTDVRHWLPDVTQDVSDAVTIPHDLPPGTYTLDIAILTQDAQFPHVNLAISGRRADGWYPLSTITVFR